MIICYETDTNLRNKRGEHEIGTFIGAYHPVTNITSQTTCTHTNDKSTKNIQVACALTLINRYRSHTSTAMFLFINKIFSN